MPLGAPARLFRKLPPWLAGPAVAEEEWKLPELLMLLDVLKRRLMRSRRWRLTSSGSIVKSPMLKDALRNDGD
jgi:hypothetical protein